MPLGEGGDQKKSLRMSNARLQSGMIRSFIRATAQPLPPVSEATGLTPAASAELAPNTPAGVNPAGVKPSYPRLSDANPSGPQAHEGHSFLDSGSRSSRASRHSRSSSSSADIVQAAVDNASKWRNWDAQAASLSEETSGTPVHGGSTAQSLEEQQEQPCAGASNGHGEPHVLRSLVTRVERHLAEADQWGFDTIELDEVSAHAHACVQKWLGVEASLSCKNGAAWYITSFLRTGFFACPVELRSESICFE